MKAKAAVFLGPGVPFEVREFDVTETPRGYGRSELIASGAVIGGSFREGEKRQISVVGKNHVIAANQVVKPGEVI